VQDTDVTFQSIFISCKALISVIRILHQNVKPFCGTATKALRLSKCIHQKQTKRRWTHSAMRKISLVHVESISTIHQTGTPTLSETNEMHLREENTITATEVTLAVKSCRVQRSREICGNWSFPSMCFCYPNFCLKDWNQFNYNYRF